MASNDASFANDTFFQGRTLQDQLVSPTDSEGSSNIIESGRITPLPTGLSTCAKGSLIAVVVVSVCELIVALQWRHTVGITLALVLLSVSIGVLVEALKPKHRALTAVWTVTASFVALLVVIHGLNQILAPPLKQWPAKCSVSGCSRVAVQNPHNKAQLAPISAFVKLEESHGSVLQFFASERQTKEIYHGAIAPFDASIERGCGSHARATSLVFGFVDDVFIKFTCDKASGNLLLEAHSERRVGMYDMDVNDRRIERLWAFLSDEAIPKLKAQPCMNVTTPIDSSTPEPMDQIPETMEKVPEPVDQIPEPMEKIPESAPESANPMQDVVATS